MSTQVPEYFQDLTNVSYQWPFPACVGILEILFLVINLEFYAWYKSGSKSQLLNGKVFILDRNYTLKVLTNFLRLCRNIELMYLDIPYDFFLIFFKTSSYSTLWGVILETGRVNLSSKYSIFKLYRLSFYWKILAVWSLSTKTKLLPESRHLGIKVCDTW